MVSSQTLNYLLNCVVSLGDGQLHLIVLLGDLLKSFKPGISTSFASGNIMASWCTWMPRCRISMVIKPVTSPSSSSFSLILDLFFSILKKTQSSISGLCHRNMFVMLPHFELHNIKENQCFDNLIWKGCRNSHHYESQQRGVEKMVIFKQQSL